MKIKLSFIAIFMLICSTGCREKAQDQSATTSSPVSEVSAFTTPTVRTFTAEYLQEFSITPGSPSYKTTGVVYYKYPDKMRLDLELERPHSRLTLMFTPTILWEWDPDKKNAQRTSLTQLRQAIPDLIPTQLTTYLVSDVTRPFLSEHLWHTSNFVPAGEEMLNNELTNVFKESTRNKKGEVTKQIFIWIGADDAFLRKKVEIQRGKVTEKEMLYNVQVNTEVPDSLFMFDPPKGAKITDLTEKYKEKMQKEKELKKRLEQLQDS